MRSEKEIRKMKENHFHDGSCCGDGLLDWVLEGEPRYSVEELMKLYSSVARNSVWEPNSDFGHSYKLIADFLNYISGNPEKVKKILEEKE